MHRGSRATRWTWALLALAACCATPWAQGDPADHSIRSLFVDRSKGEIPDGTAGRLGLLLVESGSTRQVDVDHAFRTGDQLRLEITSSRDGWVYVLHRAPGQAEAEVLWPAEPGDGDPAVHRVSARRKIAVPPSPTVIEFDEEVGQEHLYVAITAEARAPRVGGQVETREKTETELKKKIVNFSVRGLRLAAEKSVVFDPEDGDPYLYFSTPAQDPQVLAAIEFQLKHQ